jgi:hypothetical protein
MSVATEFGVDCLDEDTASAKMGGKIVLVARSSEDDEH